MITAALAVSGAARAADASAPPGARMVVTDTYHGVQVSDPYRWLEDSTDPRVHDWNVAEDKRTRQYLDDLPQRARILPSVSGSGLGDVELVPQTVRGRRASVRAVRRAAVEV